MKFVLAALVAVVVVATLTTPALALTTKVDSSTRLCISEHVAKDQSLTLQFTVVAGGKKDLDVFLYDSSDHQIQEWKMATEGRHEVHGDAANSHYKVCFSNEMARFTPKWVDFTFRKGQTAGNMHIAKAEHIDPIEARIGALRSTIDDLHDAQQRLKIAERDHRSTIEDSNDRVLLWAVFEIVALFGMGAFQIFFLKRFMERRTRA